MTHVKINGKIQPRFARFWAFYVRCTECWRKKEDHMRHSRYCERCQKIAIWAQQLRKKLPERKRRRYRSRAGQDAIRTAIISGKGSRLR